jgi:TRAP-type uncharacterized transport system substrate-binding protein
MRNYQTTLLIIIACLVFLAGGTRALAQTKDITLGCGGETGVYYRKICPALKKGLAERGLTAVPYPSTGSGANIADVAAGTRTAAVVQMDNLIRAIAEHPAYERLLPLGEIAPEALFLVIRPPSKGGRITDWRALTQDYAAGAQPERFRIAVAGRESSGSYLTMQAIVRAIPTLENNVTLSAQAGEPLSVYSYLNSGVFDAVAFVMNPDITNERIATVLKSNTWTFLNIDDPRLETMHVKQKPVYVLADIPLERSVLAGILGTGKVLRTAVTYATLLVDPQQTDVATVNALAHVANKPDLLAGDSFLVSAKKWFHTVVARVQQ